MSSTETKRNARPFVIALATIGVIVIVLNYLEIGLTLIAVAGLFAAGEFILDRLQRIGVEKLAFGSLLVAIGFVLFAIPVIGFAWQLFDNTTGVYIALAGITLLVFGYTTEYYDLNMKIINFFEKTKGQLSELLDNFRRRYLRSIWTISAFVVMVYYFVSFFVSALLQPLEIIPFLSPRINLIIIFSLLLLIEFREFIKFALGRTAELSVLLIQGILTRLKNIPGMLKSMLLGLKKLIKSIIIGSKKLLIALYNLSIYLVNSLLSNIYMIGFTGFIIFGIMSIFSKDLILSSFAIIMLIISLSILFVQKEDSVSRRLRQTQLGAYKASFRVKTLFSRKKMVNCPYCSQGIRQFAKYCVHCQRQLPTCMICKHNLNKDDEYEQCSSCKYFYHSEHIDKWTEIMPTCPTCRADWVPLK